MNLIVVVDEDNGMMFNHRRQSQDAILRDHILKMAESTALWMNTYTRKQFGSIPSYVHISENPMDEAGTGEFCFVEDLEVSAYIEKIEHLIIFRWNRRYPGDFQFGIGLGGWKLMKTYEFEGKSHEKITGEVYIR